MHKIAQLLVRRYRRQGIELTPDEVEEMLRELMDQVADKCDIQGKSQMTIFKDLLEVHCESISGR